METRWDCVTRRHISHLAARHPICPDSANYLFSVNWPECPSFLFHSNLWAFFPSFSHFLLPTPSIPIILSFSHPLSLSVSLDLATVSGDVTLSSELTVWGESYYFAPAVWVKSPLAEIREHCLLGPALLQLPHRHTWRDLPHGNARLYCHTLRNVLSWNVWLQPVTKSGMQNGCSLKLMLV